MLANDLCNGGDNWAGYDLSVSKTVNMIEAGILDPTKVTITALENAASVAGIILLTECVVVDHPEIKDPIPETSAPMMQM